MSIKEDGQVLTDYCKCEKYCNKSDGLTASGNLFKERDQYLLTPASLYQVDGVELLQLLIEEVQ